MTTTTTRGEARLGSARGGYQAAVLCAGRQRRDPFGRERGDRRGGVGRGPDRGGDRWVAALSAGAMEMAAGEWSVGSQRDTENADLALEEQELATNPEGELHELAEIYVARGLSRPWRRRSPTP